jgi:parallel beta-helix repeat protein
MKHKANRVRAGRVHTALAKAVLRMKRTPGPGFALLLAGISFLVATIDGAAAAVFIVTNTRAAGPGSLAQAITQANAASGARIEFQLPSSDAGFDRTRGIWTIRLSAPLPNVTGHGIIIDGTSQPRAVSSTEAPRIAVVAAREGVEQALAVLSDGNTIRGLAVGGFKLGVVFYGADAVSNTVTACFVGLAPGDMPMPNETGVILVQGARDNTISDCVISGNKSVGVYVADRKSRGNLLRGNHIGTDAVGQRRRPNSIGVMLARAPQNVIQSNLTA